MSKTATLRFNYDTVRWEAVFNGIKLCQSADKYRVIGMIKQKECRKAVEIGVTDIYEDELTSSIPTIETQPSIPKVPIHDRFDMVADGTNLVIQGNIPSLMVTGAPGFGKSTIVEEQFVKAGLVKSNCVLSDFTNNEDDSVTYDTSDYLIIKGSGSAKGLYRTLYDNQDKILVFDDCNKVFEDDESVMLLMAALDSSENRIVSWNKQIRQNENLPKSFQFRGGAIFLTNKSLSSIHEALSSRCIKINLDMTKDEAIDRIQHILPTLRPVFKDEVKNDAFNFLLKFADTCKEFSIRTLVKICNIRNSGISSWERLALSDIMS